MFASAIAAASTGLSASSYTVAEGTKGILQTVRVMRDMVQEYKRDPEIRSLALNIVRFLPQKDYEGEIAALFYFVRDQIRYVQDINDVETLATPDQTLQMGQGDCDDKATLLSTLLETLGFVTSFKLTGYSGREFQHVYVYVEGPGIAVHLDATEPEVMGYEPPNPTVALYVG